LKALLAQKKTIRGTEAHSKHQVKNQNRPKNIAHVRAVQGKHENLEEELSTQNVLGA
jgi:hypothetical protein